MNFKLKGIDWLTLGFCLWMLLLIAFGFNRIQNPLLHFYGYLSIIGIVLLLVWYREYLAWKVQTAKANGKSMKKLLLYTFKLLVFIRSYYPVLLYLYFFESTTAFSRVFFPRYLDPFFYRIDYWMFGYFPSLVWGLKYNSFWVKELFHFAYFAYYPMIIGLPVYFFLRKKHALDELVFILSAVFYFCYFVYSWLPVIGGRYFPEAMELSKTADGGIFKAIMAFIYTHSPHLGGAFPSSHVAIALVLSLIALKYSKAVGYVFILITLFLTISTVYCHYHWFIDAIAGVITGYFGFRIAFRVYQRLPENQNAN